MKIRVLSAMMVVFSLSASAFADGVPAPQVGIYEGKSKNGLRCKLKIVKVITDPREIRKEPVVDRDIRFGVIGEDDLPPYVLKVRVPGTLSELPISGDWSGELVDEDKALGGEYRLTGGDGYIPAPWARVVDLILDKQGNPLKYSFVNVKVVPIWHNCYNLKRVK